VPTQTTPTRMKAIISVSAMAEAVGMSRAAFYSHVQRGVFVSPLYSITNRRPFYTLEMQREILAVRETGIGSNGEYVLFYERRKEGPLAARGRHCSRPQATTHDALLDGVKALGIQSATAAQIEEAIAAAFPQGTAGVDESTVLRAVFRHLRRTGVG